MLLNKEQIELIKNSSEIMEIKNFQTFFENFLQIQVEKELKYGGVTKIYTVAPYYSYSVIQKWFRNNNKRLIPLKSLLKERIRGIILDIIGSIELPIDDPAGSLVKKGNKIIYLLLPLNTPNIGVEWKKDPNFLITNKKGHNINTSVSTYFQYGKFVYSLMGVKYRIEDI